MADVKGQDQTRPEIMLNRPPSSVERSLKQEFSVAPEPFYPCSSFRPFLGKRHFVRL